MRKTFIQKEEEGVFVLKHPPLYFRSNTDYLSSVTTNVSYAEPNEPADTVHLNAK